MAVSLLSIGLTFLAGCIGALIGGTQVFVIYGLLGTIMVIMQTCGVDVSWYNTVIMSTVFVPAVIFQGTVPAAAYASKHYDIESYNTARPLTFTQDPIVIGIAGCAAVIGWLLMSFLNQIHFPADTGATTIVILCFFWRYVFNLGQKYNKQGIKRLQYAGTKVWIYNIFYAIICAALTCFFVKETGITSIGFYFSALSLMYGFFDPHAPCSHQITMPAGYAMAATGNIFIAIGFGILAHLIHTCFGEVFNVDCGTFIDPAAVAIASTSLIIFLVF